MENEIVNILNKLESNGFECYVIGGYVRDKLLGIVSTDIDIVTNALPKDLISIFNISQNRTNLYGTMKINTDKYRFDIATYRKEISYNGRKPDKIEYIHSIEEDILRRDFTINTIAMDKEGHIKDTLRALSDLQNKMIRSVGDPNDKLKEDPLRILRALRFSIILDFKIENNLMNAIKKNINLIESIPLSRVKEEIDKILVNSNSPAGFDFLNKLGVLKLLNINYDKLVYVDDIMGMYAQLQLPDEYPFTKEELRNINLIKGIIKQGKINSYTLYYNDLYISLVAGKVLGIPREDIINIYNNLPIKSEKDLELSFNDISKVLNIEPSNIIKNVESDIINKILSKELNNNKDDLVSYIINNKDVYLNE